MSYRLTHSAVVVSLTNRYPDQADLIEEYINESEHQDGRDCWHRNFPRLGSVFADFELYAEGTDRAVRRGDITDEEAKIAIATAYVKTAREMNAECLEPGEEESAVDAELIGDLVYEMLEDMQDEIHAEAVKILSPESAEK